MRVAFVLPEFKTSVSGGYRVVYEYANGLSRRGHDVAIVAPAPGLQHRGVRRWTSPHAYVERVRSRGRRTVPWFGLDDAVELLVPRHRTPDVLPSADATVATAWHTAGLVARRPARSGTGSYLIQHFETWDGPRPMVEATWRLPLHKVVISRWLLELAEQLDPGSATAYIPNGIDHEQFRVVVPPTDRDPFHVGMLYHDSRWKGTDIGVRALVQARHQEPRLRATLYGRKARPRGLPGWIDYRAALAGDALTHYFNTLALFVHPSLAEGWPLPPAEAMACGAAAVVADNPGVLDYAEPARTAHVVPRGDPGALAQGVLELVRDDERRRSLAENGARAIRRYTWQRATDELEHHLATTGPTR